MKRSYEFIIVGGGLIGCSIASELAKESKSVLLLEKGKMGQEASYAGAGMLMLHGGHSGDHPLVSLLRQSLAFYPSYIHDLEAETNMPTGYVKSGSLYLGLNEKDRERVHRFVKWQKEMNITHEYWEQPKIHENEDWLSNPEATAVFLPEDGQVDNRLLVGAVTQQARLRGVEIIEDAEVTDWMIQGEKIQGVCVGNEKYEASKVILAQGAWTGAVLNLPFSVPVKPSKGQMFSLKAKRPIFKHILHYHDWYLVPRADGRMLIGATVENVGFDKKVNISGMKEILSLPGLIHPEMDKLEINEIWAGLRPRPKDGRPIMGPTPIDGLWIATGHFRNGILLAGWTAKIMKDWILSGDPGVDVEPFLLSRFNRQSNVHEEEPAKSI